MQHLPFLTIRQVNRLLSTGLLTAEQLCRYCHALAVAGENIWNLHAYDVILPMETVLEQARLSDIRRITGNTRSILDGIPVSFKANLAIESLPLTAGSRVLGAGNGFDGESGCAGEPEIRPHLNGTFTGNENSPFRNNTSLVESSPPPIGYNAAVTHAILAQSGGVLIGQTSMDEFGMGSLGTHRPSPHLRTCNPRPFLHTFQTCVIEDVEVVRILAETPEDAIHESHDRIRIRWEKEMQDIQDNLRYSAGGSSCGAAASVAHGSSLLAVGSDTGGSIRLPAAWCGVVGLKPTFGLLSRHGLVPYASSLDTIGLMAPSADCLSLAFPQVVSSQRTDQDSNCLPKLASPITVDETKMTHIVDGHGSFDQVLKGINVGIPEAFHVAECPDSIRTHWTQTAHALQQLGAHVTVVSSNHISPKIIQHSLASYYLLACAEASSNLARYDGVRYGTEAPTLPSDEMDGTETESMQDWNVLDRNFARSRSNVFGKEIVRRVLCGTFVLSSDRFHSHYEAAASLRSILTEQLHTALQTVDLLVVPSVLFPPSPLLEQRDPSVDGTAMTANDVMTVAVSLAGLPAIAVPCGSKDLMFRPSMQLIGSRLGEGTLLRAAAALEQIGCGL